MSLTTRAHASAADRIILEYFLKGNVEQSVLEQRALVDRLGVLDAAGKYELSPFGSNMIQVQGVTMDPMDEAALCYRVIPYIGPLRNALRALSLANDFPDTQFVMALAALWFGRRVQGLFQNAANETKTGENCYPHVRIFFATYNNFAISVEGVTDDTIDFGHVKNSISGLVQDLDNLKTGLTKVAIGLGRPLPENVKLVHLASKAAETAAAVQIGADMMSAKIQDSATVANMFSQKLVVLSRTISEHPHIRHLVDESLFTGGNRLIAVINDLATKNSLMTNAAKRMNRDASQTAALSAYHAAQGVPDEIIKIEDDAPEDAGGSTVHADRDAYLEDVRTTLGLAISRGPNDQLIQDLQELLGRHPDYSPENEDMGKMES